MTRRNLGALATALALAAALSLPPDGDSSRTAPPPPEAEAGGGRTLTGKERLSAKWRDEQRVDDCKVPEPLRGTRHRPAGCGHPR